MQVLVRRENGVDVDEIAGLSWLSCAWIHALIRTARPTSGSTGPKQVRRPWRVEPGTFRVDPVLGDRRAAQTANCDGLIRRIRLERKAADGCPLNEVSGAQ